MILCYFLTIIHLTPSLSRSFLVFKNHLITSHLIWLQTKVVFMANRGSICPLVTTVIHFCHSHPRPLASTHTWLFLIHAKEGPCLTCVLGLLLLKCASLHISISGCLTSFMLLFIHHLFRKKFPNKRYFLVNLYNPLFLAN